MKIFNQYFYLMLLMVVCSFIPYLMQPTTYLSDLKPPVSLIGYVPKEFSGWKVLDNKVANIVDPELQQSLSNIYSETLSLSFINDKDQVVMLSIAYSPAQTEGKYIHYPAVCYPSAGFKIESINQSVLKTKFADIRIKKMFAVANARFEPVTYWALVGNQVVLDESDSKLQRVKYGLKGIIPDAILFRVSTLNVNASEGFELNEHFINDLLEALPPDRRSQLIGI